MRALAVAAATLAGAAIAASTASAQLIYTQIPEPGDTFANACTETPLHAEPNGYADVVGTASFKQTFEVVALAGKYLLPKSMRYSTTHGSTNTQDAWKQQRGEAEYDPRDFFPAWAEVRTEDGTAFIPMRCLVSVEFAEEQNIENAERKFEQAKVSGAGKGFALKPASGGSGKGLAGTLASAGRNSEAVEYLLERRTANPQAAFADFRQAGGLGEFATGIDDPGLRDTPARDVRREPEGDLGDALFGN
jgi:hypothetical protein